MSISIATTPDDRTDCLAIRMRVFVHEQGVPPELEADDLDADAVHLLLRDDATHEPLATARLAAKDHLVVKIGRVAVLANRRGTGLGRAIMTAALDAARQRGFQEAALTAQTRALPFYEALGFIAEGDEFLEAGIPHYWMRRPL